LPLRWLDAGNNQCPNALILAPLPTGLTISVKTVEVKMAVSVYEHKNSPIIV